MSRTIEEIVSSSLRRVRRDTNVSLAFAGMVKGRSTVHLQHFEGETKGVIDGVSIEVGHGLGGRVVALRRPMVVDDYLETPRISHRYNDIIEQEELRAMMAAPVIVDRVPIAVIYGALHTPRLIGDRMLDTLASEARAIEQEIASARALLEYDAHSPDKDLRNRVTAAFARLRQLVEDVDDQRLSGELTDIIEMLTAETDAKSMSTNITAREQDVLAFVALGYPNARIADSLGLTVNTVKGYMKGIMHKLGASSRLEAVVLARSAGLLP
ncbi:LuxR C-terminal-related transcriptional regulator [Gordonia sp. Swx-4]|uniref:LuxR C-terminal-related transcriptional regulator n=1 Tax=Gordonia sp. Swx-4 TaxID=3029399 RepID=UPI0025745F87|nr:LuxR C-terminal-related transcriptional regulator [Gordonia sp. Swx-4]WJG15446.1 LuxR C-terminal-related transcriptional regulator [Gordonia sp. Swx-4]